MEASIRELACGLSKHAFVGISKKPDELRVFCAPPPDQCEIIDRMGLDQDSVMIIHGGVRSKTPLF